MVRAIAYLMVILMASLSAEAAGKTAHNFTFTSIDGGPLPLSDFKGKAILVVNTASECGYTPQYKDLQALWQRYRDRGLVVVGVPSNDFGGQEPGTEAEIKRFCERQYAVDLPLTAKEHVTDQDAHPFYRWAAEVAGEAAGPRWNNYLGDAPRPDEARIHQLFAEAVEIECEFLRARAPRDSLLLDLPAIISYVRYSADRLLQAIGASPLFGAPAPAADFPMALMVAEKHTNFFERRSTNYTGTVVNDL